MSAEVKDDLVTGEMVEIARGAYEKRSRSLIGGELEAAIRAVAPMIAARVIRQIAPDDQQCSHDMCSCQQRLVAAAIRARGETP
jgi:hypothetical protein